MYSQEIERRRIPVQTYGEMYTECEYSKKNSTWFENKEYKKISNGDIFFNQTAPRHVC